MSREVNENKLQNMIYRHAVEGLLVDGHLVEGDLKDKISLAEKVVKLIRNAEFDLFVDHRDEILKAAIKFQVESRCEFSLTFYATFFEHTINYIISKSITVKGGKSKTAESVIRTASIDAKFGWVLDLIGLPPINSTHKNVILKIAEARNAFVHYKWRPVNDNSFENKETELNALLNSARKAAAYIKNYEAKNLYKGKKSRINKLSRR